MEVSELQREALKLPATDRAQLAEAIWASLDEPTTQEKAWLAEAEKAWNSFQRGETKAVEGSVAMQAARDAIRK